MDSTETLEAARKRLGWRASHRGIKEMDIIVGGFAREMLPRMDAGALAAFEDLLEVPDQDLLAYVTGQKSVPTALDTELMRALLAYRPS